MELTQAHLDLLVCPVCFARLALTQSQDAIDCLGCRLQYPIAEGLPVLLAGRAKRSQSTG